jgi:D-inositol-3-phosphate glycosyltransferase
MYHTLGFLKNRVARNQDEQERAIRIQWEWEIARRVDALVASHPLERALLIWHYDAVPDRVQVIPCGVDLSLFRPIEREIAHQALGLKPRPWLLFVGRLEPIKGLDTLLKAIFLLKKHGGGLSDIPALLVIGGNKDQADSPGVERELMGQVAALGLERSVFLMGSRPQVDLPFFYAASEACILPSRYESFGMVALEAMACGRPVIASRVGGLSYTVRDGVNGFLVPEGDAESLADKISLLLSDSKLRNELGRRAAERAKLFRWERVVETLLGLYGNLLVEGERQATFTSDQYGFLEEGLGP